MKYAPHLYCKASFWITSILFVTLLGCKTMDPRDSTGTIAYYDIEGSEDIVIDTESGIAYISSADLRTCIKQRPDGVIYALDLNNLQLKLKDLTCELLSEGVLREFSPHGIALYKGAQGKNRLFVINHKNKEENTVEIFDVQGFHLTHHCTIELPRDTLFRANDLAPVGPDQFYVSNWLGSKSGFGQFFESLFNLPKSYVVFVEGRCDSEEEQPANHLIAADRLKYANGVGVSADGKTLYVATSIGRTLYLYDIQPDRRLTNRRDLRIGPMLDNIDIDEDGAIWLGSHQASKFRFLFFALGWSNHSPSAVYRVLVDGDQLEAQRILSKRELTLPGVSIAARRDSTLLVGSVFHGFLVLEPGVLKQYRTVAAVE